MSKFNQIAAFGKELMALNDMDNALELIAKEAKNMVGADRCSIL